MKIDLHMVDTQKGQRVWGEQYCRELKADSLIALQEEIARQVAARIGSLYGIILQTLSRESRKKPPESLEQALVAARKGAALETGNQITRTALAHVYFFRNERELFLSEAETALALNPNAAGLIGFLGWLLALYGEWEQGLAILEKGIKLNPHYPGWFHLAPFFNYYLQERCEEAYQEALAFQMPQLFWDPLLRAAALGRLGRKQEGTQALAELLHLRPDFPTTGPFLISCYAKFPYLN